MIFFSLNIFLAFVWIVFVEQLKKCQKQGEREGDIHAAKGPSPGLEPRPAAARAKPLYMGRCSTL